MEKHSKTRALRGAAKKSRDRRAAQGLPAEPSPVWDGLPHVCPACKSQETEVWRTWITKYPPARSRRRYCRECHHKWITDERPRPDDRQRP